MLDDDEAITITTCHEEATSQHEVAFLLAIFSQEGLPRVNVSLLRRSLLFVSQNSGAVERALVTKFLHFVAISLFQQQRDA